jgi:hypothetical protein
MEVTETIYILHTLVLLGTHNKKILIMRNDMLIYNKYT